MAKTEKIAYILEQVTGTHWCTLEPALAHTGALATRRGCWF